MANKDSNIKLGVNRYLMVPINTIHFLIYKRIAYYNEL